jgi:hypothetical protein
MELSTETTWVYEKDTGQIVLRESDRSVPPLFIPGIDHDDRGDADDTGSIDDPLDLVDEEVETEAERLLAKRDDE